MQISIHLTTGAVATAEVDTEVDETTTAEEVVAMAAIARGEIDHNTHDLEHQGKVAMGII